VRRAESLSLSVGKYDSLSQNHGNSCHAEVEVQGYEIWHPGSSARKDRLTPSAIVKDQKEKILF
jgi:hypothetical protein